MFSLEASPWSRFEPLSLLGLLERSKLRFFPVILWCLMLKTLGAAIVRGVILLEEDSETRV